MRVSSSSNTAKQTCVTRLPPNRYARRLALLRSMRDSERTGPYVTTRILVVEDDADVRYVVSDALQDAGYAVATAMDGADALDQIDQHRPDAILLDLAMPLMDGWSFLEACHSDDRFARIPVGIMSAAPVLCRTADAFGVQVAIAKPFALDELIARVGHLIDPLAVPEE
jgi:CheY-like chemotaxis protein